MRKDTSFSDKKMCDEDFSDKYWLGGKCPHQYHTMNISDGRDEREQLIINNIRALREMISILLKHEKQTASNVDINTNEAQEKLDKLLATSKELLQVVKELSELGIIITREEKKKPSLPPNTTVSPCTVHKDFPPGTTIG